MEPEKHPSEERLEEYSRGTLPEAEVERLEEHLLVCALCQDRLSEMDVFVDATRQAARKVQADPPSALEDGLRDLGRLAVKPPVVAVMAAGLVAAVALTARVSTDPATAFPVRLEALRGASPLNSHAPAGRRLSLRLDLAGVPESPSYRVEVVDGEGRVAFDRVVPQNGDATANLTGVRLPAGRHWVRVYEPGPSGALLREYGLIVE